MSYKTAIIIWMLFLMSKKFIVSSNIWNDLNGQAVISKMIVPENWFSDGGNAAKWSQLNCRDSVTTICLLG